MTTKRKTEIFGTFTRGVAVAFGLALLASTVLAAPATFRLRVDGLSCPFCSYGIEKKLGAVKGVQRVETHIREGAVIVTMKDDATLDEATANLAVKEAGFSLRKFEQVPAAAQTPPAGESRSRVRGICRAARWRPGRPWIFRSTAS